MMPIVSKAVRVMPMSNVLKGRRFSEGEAQNPFGQGGRWRRMREISADCRVILKYLFSGGSVTFDWRNDCLVISGKPAA
jgi:hypothetical protein